MKRLRLICAKFSTALSLFLLPWAVVLLGAQVLPPESFSVFWPTFVATVLQVSATDPTVANDPNDRRAIDINCVTSNTNTNSLFSIQSCQQMLFTAYSGMLFQGLTNAKTSFIPYYTTANMQASGQRFIYTNTMNCYGMGDCGIWGNNSVTFAGADISGDEGQGWGSISHMQQQQNLVLKTINSAPAKTTCNTTFGISSTVTITIASPAIVTWTGSNFAAGQAIQFSTTGTLPTGITAGSFYYVLATGLGANSFEISATPGGAAINTSGSQSGVQTGGTVIVGGYTAQTVQVGSTTGCNVNDWVVVEQQTATSTPNMEAVQITAVSSGVISGIFRNNHNNAVTITPALVLSLSDAGQLGQDRVLVNLSQSSYSTGTVASITGATFTGSGTAWTNNIVGGTSTNIGCIALTADDYSGAPFNGSGAQGTLKSWYQITSVSSGTSLSMYSTSVATPPGVSVYQGKGPGSGGYIIRPCVHVLRIAGAQVIAESTSTTWAVNDNVELSIAPYPDVTGFQYEMNVYNPGGSPRGFMAVRNNGARTFQFGFSAGGTMATGSNADTATWNTAFTAQHANTAFAVTDAKQQAMLLSCGSFCGDSSDLTGRISWTPSGAYVQANSTNIGMDLQWNLGAAGTTPGLMQSKSNLAGTSLVQLKYNGMLTIVAGTFSQLPSCTDAIEGSQFPIIDGSSATFNAALSGGMSNHVNAYCAGTTAGWRVH